MPDGVLAHTAIGGPKSMQDSPASSLDYPCWSHDPHLAGVSDPASIVNISQNVLT